MKLAIVGHERCPAFSDLPDAISLGTNLLARGMARRGHDVTLFSPLPPLSAPGTWPCRVEVFPGFKGADTSSFRFGACYFDWVEEVCDNDSYWDVVYVANRPEALGVLGHGFFSGSRNIVVAYDTPLEYTRNTFWWSADGRTRHITCSDFMAGQLQPLFNNPVKVVRHGFDLEVYREVPGQTRYPAVLFAGRHVVEKGITAAIEALNGTDRCAKTLCGDGPCRVPFGVDHHPRNWGSEMPRWYSKHRVVVVPSVWPDPAPRVAMEALLCGCAVVHSGAGGLPEIEGENTFAFNYKGDLAEMVRLVQKVLDMPEEEFRQQSAQSVTEARGRWSEERFLNDMERVFCEVSEQ